LHLRASVARRSETTKQSHVTQKEITSPSARNNGFVEVFDITSSIFMEKI
jgi:hypothetical protein